MKKTKDQSNQDANEKTPDQRELNIRGELNERFPEDQLRSSAAMAVPKRSDASLTARGVTSPRSFYLTEAEIAALKKDKKESGQRIRELLRQQAPPAGD